MKNFLLLVTSLLFVVASAKLILSDGDSSPRVMIQPISDEIDKKIKNVTQNRKRLILRCDVPDSLERNFQVTWYKGNILIQEDNENVVIPETNMLIVYDASVTDKGLYTCRISSILPRGDALESLARKASPRKVLVYIPRPEGYPHTRSMTVAEGSGIKIFCMRHSDVAHENVTWIKYAESGRYLDEDAKERPISSSANYVSNPDSTVLCISETKEGDRGWYSCTVKGMDTKNWTNFIRVRVYDPWRIGIPITGTLIVLVALLTIIILSEYFVDEDTFEAMTQSEMELQHEPDDSND